VLSAAGTTTWELLVLGACTALVCVADNQASGYQRAVTAGAAAGIGMLSDLVRDPAAATRTLAQLLRDPHARAALSRRAWHLVDGRGRQRVADALLALL
jgi:spore coat polysaccharide biosynthesis predicted glycosyltransferase SpsG